MTFSFFFFVKFITSLLIAMKLYSFVLAAAFKAR